MGYFLWGQRVFERIGVTVGGRKFATWLGFTLYPSLFFILPDLILPNVYTNKPQVRGDKTARGRVCVGTYAALGLGVSSPRPHSSVPRESEAGHRAQPRHPLPYELMHKTVLGVVREHPDGEKGLGPTK